MTKESRKAQQEAAIADYEKSYAEFAASRITSEEAAIRMSDASRRALDLGVSIQDLRKARSRVDNHSQFMTDWK